MDDPDGVPSISGNDVIMAYGSRPQTFLRPNSYVQHSSDSRVCSSLFWSRYILFVINFLVLGAGATLIAVGCWALVNDDGLNLFEDILILPSWLMVVTGIVMVVLGVAGCAGTLRLNVFYLRLFMVLVVAVFVLQLVLAATVFFLMDDLEHDMLDTLRDVILVYVQDSGKGDDLSLDYIQREFDCCGASSYSDWEANPYYNCSNSQSPSACGVPSSCCRGARDAQCGFELRGGTIEYADMFAYTEGCVVILMDILKDNMIIIVALAFTVSVLELGSMILANMVVKKMVYHRKLLSS